MEAEFVIVKRHFGFPFPESSPECKKVSERKAFSHHFIQRKARIQQLEGLLAKSFADLFDTWPPTSIPPRRQLSLEAPELLKGADVRLKSNLVGVGAHDLLGSPSSACMSILVLIIETYAIDVGRDELAVVGKAAVEGREPTSQCMGTRHLKGLKDAHL